MRGVHSSSGVHGNSEHAGRSKSVVLAALMCVLAIAIVGLSTWESTAGADEAIPVTTLPPEPAPPAPGEPPSTTVVPPEPTIFPTVVPSTGLVDGQTVVLSASGLPAGATVGLAQCDSNARGTESCDLSNTRLGQVDGSGNFESDFTVVRQPNINGTLVDCAAVQCIIGIGVLEDDLLTPRETGGAVLSFDASVPLPDPPSITLSKAKKLKDGQKVKVRGQGWSEDSYDVSIEQCAMPVSPHSPGGEGSDVICRYIGSGPVLIGGGIEVDIRVRRTFYSNQKAIDCAAETVSCQIVVRSYGRSIQMAAAELSFDASIPLPPSPQLNVKPRRGLVDGQTVTVTVSNYTLRQEWNLMQCVIGANGALNQCTYLPREDDGSSSLSVTVSRAVVSNRTIVDCAAKPNRCALVLTEYDSGLTIKRGLIFASTDEPLAEPAVTYSDNLDSLVDGARVTADVTGPMNSVMLAQCPEGVGNPQRCTQLGGAYFEGDAEDDFGEDEPVEAEEEEAVEELAINDFTVEGDVRRVVWQNGKAVDCAAETGSCVLVAWDYELGVVGEPAPLTFVDEGPPVLPKVKVKKKKLAANEVVTARFTGMPVNSYLEVMQCVRGDRNACLYLPGTSIESAEFSYRLRIRQFVPSQIGQIDCAATPKACELRFSSSPGQWSVNVPLRFDPDAPAAPGAQVSVKPSRKLEHFQQVDLVVENLFGYFGIMQCPGKVTDTTTTGCTYIGSDEWNMDEESGSTTAKITVRRILSTPGGRIDCAAKKQQCKIVVFDESVGQEVASTRIRFNAKIKAPGLPSLLVSPTENLVDGQDVEIIARTDSSRLSVQQCAGVSVGQPARRCRQVSYSRFEGEPQKFVASVSRMIVGNDCAEVECSLLLTNENTGVVEVAVPLSFDPSAALMGSPRLDVTPRTGLADRQIVEATFSNFLGSHFYLQCVVEDGKATDRCTGVGNHSDQQTRRSTTVSSLTVRRTIAGHDCASAANSCALVVRYYGDETGFGPEEGMRQKKRLLSFDPNAQALPGASIQVDQAKGLTNGQVVDVTGSNWSPESTVFLGICSEPFALDSPEEFPGTCADEPSAYVEVEPDGTFSVEVPLTIDQSSSEGGDGFDCLDGCVLLATDGYDLAFVEISFAADGSATVTEVRNGLAWPESFGPRFGES